MTIETGALPGVSVVTIALNAAERLPLTLESIIAQDYPTMELVVVDGASWDSTARIVDRYTDHIDKLRIEEDSGIYAAMNKSLDLVSMDYVLFMNAGDQFFCSDAISRIMRAIVGKPDIVYGNHVYVDRGLELFKRSARFDVIARRLADGLIDGPWLESIPCHQATFARADLLRQLRFDTRLRVSADHEFLFRAYDQGAQLQYVDEIVSHYFGGGFSAAMGERTRLEGASVYRRFSDRPDAVDRFFYPAATPFSLQTERTGARLSGFYRSQNQSIPEGTLAAGDWVAAGGCQFISSKQECQSLEISGFNEFRNQHAIFYLGDDRIGSSPIPTGSFRLEIDFDRLIPGASVITLRPRRSGSAHGADNAEVAFALRSFRFNAADVSQRARLKPGDEIFFREGLSADFMAALGAGWSQPEATHIWGIGEHSELWLKADQTVSVLRFFLSGNPHVPEGRQPVEILINGLAVAGGMAEHGGAVMLDVDCTRAGWHRGGINRVTIRPGVVAAPPSGSGDERLLGMCLWRLEAI